MNKQIFSIDLEGIELIGDIIPSKNHPRILCLHGAGLIGRNRFDKLRELLFDKNIASCAFDFIGHGESGGHITSSSLDNKTNQALIVIKSQKLSQPLSIIASSMSGHIAIQLTKSLQIENLILIAPAIYTTKAYSVTFGSKFTEIIRKPYSWLNSDAWNILKNYTGNLLIFEAEKDQVIPHKVIEKIYNSAIKTKSKEIIVIQNATHPLIKWITEHPIFLKQVFDKIHKAIQ
ncbi:MAG: alpha/beta hydrolase [Candidatus Kuenenbacteria bacterium]